MNATRRIIVTVIFCLVWVGETGNACVSPIIWIQFWQKFISPGDDFEFVAECCDGGPIVEWEWIADPCCIDLVWTENPDSSSVMGQYDAIGKYYVWAYGTNSYDLTGSDWGRVWVFQMDADIGLSEEAEEDPGISLGIGDTTTLSLRYEPTSLWESGQTQRLWVPNNSNTIVQVHYGGQVVIGGTDNNEVWPLVARQPRDVTVEGCSPGWVFLYHQFRLAGDLYPGSVNSDRVKVNVVKVWYIVKAGTSDEGPLYVVCPQDTIQLQAKPAPEEWPWPPGEPHWEIVSQPAGASATVDPNSGSDVAEVSGFTEPGEYVVRAKCGSLDVGDDITLMTPPPKNRYWEFNWSFHCPTRPGEAYCKAWPDDCANETSIICEGASFHFYYKPCNGTRTQVGQCIWLNGQNTFFYWLHLAPDGKVRFLETHQVTLNDAAGVDSDGEGCRDYYCWRLQKHNCVTNSEIGHWWRKATAPQSVNLCDETSGSECLGQDGDHGAIPLFPN